MKKYVNWLTKLFQQQSPPFFSKVR